MDGSVGSLCGVAKCVAKRARASLGNNTQVSLPFLLTRASETQSQRCQCQDCGGQCLCASVLTCAHPNCRPSGSAEITAHQLLQQSLKVRGRRICRLLERLEQQRASDNSNTTSTLDTASRPTLEGHRFQRHSKEHIHRRPKGSRRSRARKA
jgi:hypothetical protein